VRAGTRFASPASMKLNHLKVADLMSTALLTIAARDIVSHADAEMRLAGVRHLVVVDDRQRLVGILSNRDLLAALARAGGKGVRVSDVMTKNPRSVTANDSALKAASLMLEHKIGSLPVIGDEGQLVGIVTETDFLQLACRVLGG
jgi:CBS domain-containing protein